VRIVLVTAAPPEIHCGVGDYTANLAGALAEIGEEVTVVRGALVNADLGACRKVRAGVRERAVVKDWSVAGLPTLRRKVLESGPDVVHIQFPGRGYGRSLGPNLLPWVLRRRGRARLVMTLHEYGIASWKGRLRIVLGALGSDALVFPDETIAAAMTSVVARLGAKSTRVIPIASNIERSALEIDRRAVRADWKVPAGALAVGWFGLLTHEKGALALIEALKAIRGRRQMVLVIVGDIGTQREASELTSALSAEAPTTFTGPLPEAEAAAVIASLDVIALPFTGGLTGRRGSYLAARAQGTYIVTTHVSRRGYDRVSNTHFVAPNDASALAAAILEAPDRERQSASATMTWAEIARAHAELYRSI